MNPAKITNALPNHPTVAQVVDAINALSRMQKPLGMDTPEYWVIDARLRSMALLFSALQTKTEKIGTASSGFHGHAGRPGERGGSVADETSRAGNPEDGEYTREMYIKSVFRVAIADGVLKDDTGKAADKLKNTLMGSGLDDITLSGFNGVIADELAKRSGMSRQEVLDYMRAWRDGASNNPSSIAMQYAAADKFGVSRDFIDTKADRNGITIAQEGIDKARGLIDAVYDVTQERLAAMGVKEVTLYRGERGWKTAPAGAESADGLVNRVDTNPMTSFSSSPSIARSFAENPEGGAVTHMIDVVTVPAARVLSMATTGLGAIQEQEFILTGGPMTVRTYNMGDTDYGQYIPSSKTMNGVVQHYLSGIHRGFFG